MAKRNPTACAARLVPGGDLDLSAWMEGALGTISISAVRLLVGSTCNLRSEGCREHATPMMQVRQR